MIKESRNLGREEGRKEGRKEGGRRGEENLADCCLVYLSPEYTGIFCPGWRITERTRICVNKGEKGEDRVEGGGGRRTKGRRPDRGKRKGGGGEAKWIISRVIRNNNE